jgi:3-hydroxyacyl-CoA dehydrogenase
MDKLLAKDVSKGKITQQDANDARARITVVPESEGIKGIRDVDLVVEVINIADESHQDFIDYNSRQPPRMST